MAYVSKELKARLVAKAKPILKKYGVKATFSVHNYSTLNCNINSAPWNLLEGFDRNYAQLTHHSVGDSYGNRFKDYPKSNEFLGELFAALNSENHDNSDIMTDYFDVGYYLYVNVGQWDKPFITA